MLTKTAGGLNQPPAGFVVDFRSAGHIARVAAQKRAAGLPSSRRCDVLRATILSGRDAASL